MVLVSLEEGLISSPQEAATKCGKRDEEKEKRREGGGSGGSGGATREIYMHIPRLSRVALLTAIQIQGK